MKYNKRASDPKATTNYEGGLTFKADPEVELVLRAVSSLVSEPKFYVNERTLDNELIALIHNVSELNPLFVLKLAAYCRKELHLRSVPMMILAEYANTEHPNVPYSRQYVTDCIERVDDMIELIAYQLARYPRDTGKIPMMLKFGIASAFSKFDEYQFAKYNRDGKVKLRDVMFLCRPKPADPVRQKLYNDIADDNLATPETWEVVVSLNDGKSKYEKWTEIAPKMGYMALLRNLRNMLQAGIHMEPINSRIKDRKAIIRSKQMPFRYFSAYKELLKLEHTALPDPWQVPGVLSALEEALEISVENIPKIPGKTLIAVDVSGSMQTPLSRNSSINYIDIATLYGSLASHICENAIVSEFADDFRIVQVPRTMNPLQATKSFTYGGATYAHLIMDWLLKTGTVVDRIIVFSDFQVYEQSGYRANYPGLVEKYRQQVNRDVYLYTIDLAGYGTTLLRNDKRVALIGGWSDRVFEFIGYFEKDGRTMVDAIASYQPTGQE